MTGEARFKTLLFVLAVSLFLIAASPDLGISNMDRLFLKDSTTGAILNVNQTGAGDIVRFQDGGSTVWSLADGGDVTFTGDQTTTGSLAVIGAEDELQFVVTGYTTQTSSLMVLEQSGGTDAFVVDNDGNITTMGAVSEAILIDGEADEVQLTVQGHTTQTNASFVTERLDGTDVFSISDDGAVFISNTLAVGGDVTFANDETLGNSNDGFLDFSEGRLAGTTSLTITASYLLTPTYEVYRINAADAHEMTLMACAGDGQSLILYFEDTHVITVADTNIRTGDGAAVLVTQYDILEWICIADEWSLVAEQNLE